jgi:hypothetical protein
MEGWSTSLVVAVFLIGLAAKRSWGWMNSPGNEKAKEAAGNAAGAFLKRLLK